MSNAIILTPRTPALGPSAQFTKLILIDNGDGTFSLGWIEAPTSGYPSDPSQIDLTGARLLALSTNPAGQTVIIKPLFTGGPDGLKQFAFGFNLLPDSNPQTFTLPATGGTLVTTDTLPSISALTLPMSVAGVATPTSIAVSNANQIRMMRFILPARMAFTQVGFTIATQQAGSLFSFGIANLAGQLLIDSGPISGASSALTSAVLAVPGSLPQGDYYYVLTSNNASLLLTGITWSSSAVVAINHGAAWFGLAAETSVNGQLPSSLTIVPGSGSISYVITCWA